MKNSPTISLVLAAGVTGVAFVKLASSSFLAALPVEGLIAGAVSAAVLTLAVYDYSRRTQPLTFRARVLRPALPVAVGPGPARPAVNSNRDERAAA